MIDYDKAQLARVAIKYKLKFVILHGSYAIGRSRKGSDLDVVILGEKEPVLGSELKLHSEFSKIFGDNELRELDLKTLYKVDPLFRYEVARDGILLYGDPSDYEEFKAVSQRLYEDAQPLRALEKILSKKYQRHLNIISAKYA